MVVVVDTFMTLLSLKQVEKGIMFRLQVLMINTHNEVAATEISEQGRAEQSTAEQITADQSTAELS